jgi:ZIP family zinc transporter
MLSDLVDIMILSGLAGLATGLGGLIAVIRRPGRKTLGFLMGLAAGIMMMLSFLELMSEALKISGLFLVAAGFTTGSILMFSLDFVLPHKYFAVDEKGLLDGRLLKKSAMIAIGISLHNFPEGIAVALGYSFTPRLGLVMAVAIGLHNIPEGIATSLPMYAAGSSRRSAVGLALASGLVEPLGALLAGIFLTAFHDLVPFGLAFASGVMVFITMDELIPVAHEQGHEHFISLGLITGCIATFILIGTLG